jgi:acetyl-CoA acyltransferase 1
MAKTQHVYRNSSDDDVVIVAAIRTPLIRASNAKKEGQFGNVSPAEMLQTVLESTLQQVKHGIKGSDVQDLCVGNVLMAPSNFTTLRMAAIAAGLSAETCSMNMVNRQCASGLQAIANIANRISANEIDIGIGAGVESMSMFPMNQMKLTKNAIDWSSIKSNKEAMDCLLPMGITSDTVAIRYNQKVITVPSSSSSFSSTKEHKIKLDMDRLTLDQFAVESHRRAHVAQINGTFQNEICAVRGTIQKDDGIRSNTTIDGLSRLRPIFTPNTGVTTAGNSSQLTDGAAAVLLMRRSVAIQRSIPILAVWKGYTCCGVPPSVMGIGPSVAIPELLQRLQLHIHDIDRIELNEAFATQALYCIQLLQLDPAKVNVNGGAIALGHPLGATGARMIVSLINTLHQLRSEGAATSGKKDSLYGCASMCVGTGMGAAAVIEIESDVAVHSGTYGVRRSSL